MTQLQPTLHDALDAAPSARPAPARWPRLLFLAAGLLFLVVAAFSFWWLRPPQLHGVLVQSSEPVADFTLQASTGVPLSLSDLRGKYVLLYFGYTYCPDVCPTTLNALASARNALGEKLKDQLQVVLITVDPERDTPQELAAYLSHFDPSFVGLSGAEEQIQSVAGQFGIYFARQPASSATDYMVDHTSAITLIDPEGRVQMIFGPDVSATEMAADLRYLMRQ